MARSFPAKPLATCSAEGANGVAWAFHRAIRQRRGTERAEFATLFGVSLLPAALDLLARFNVGPLPGFNLAPFALVPSFAALVWMVARFDTFDVMSAMHTLLLHRIPSLVFVVDDGGLVLEANDAAATALGAQAIISVAIRSAAAARAAVRPASPAPTTSTPSCRMRAIRSAPHRHGGAP